jgi:protein-disulfide isomerase
VAQESVGSAQKQDLEHVIHDYLLNHPEIILQSLQQAEMHEAKEQVKKVILNRRAELVADASAPVAGNPTSDVTIVEFFDYQCPYCKGVEPTLQATLHAEPDLRFVYKEFPVLGPASMFAARAALAAARQDKYVAFRHALLALKGSLSETVVFQTAASLGIDTDRLRGDMNAPEIGEEIQRNLDLGRALLIQGTPAFVIGDTLVTGAIDSGSLQQKIGDLRKTMNP